MTGMTHKQLDAFGHAVLADLDRRNKDVFRTVLPHGVEPEPEPEPERRPRASPGSTHLAGFDDNALAIAGAALDAQKAKLAAPEPEPDVEPEPSPDAKERAERAALKADIEATAAQLARLSKELEAQRARDARVAEAEARKAREVEILKADALLREARKAKKQRERDTETRRKYF